VTSVAPNSVPSQAQLDRFHRSVAAAAPDDDLIILLLFVDDDVMISCLD